MWFVCCGVEFLLSYVSCLELGVIAMKKDGWVHCHCVAMLLAAVDINTHNNKYILQLFVLCANFNV